MSELTCFRLLDAESPAGPLADAVRQVNLGLSIDGITYSIPRAAFQIIPTSPIAYWAGLEVSELFRKNPLLEALPRTAKSGLRTTDNFRFVRCFWEVKPRDVFPGGGLWVNFAKGGAYSQFYADLHLVVKWERGGIEIKNYPGSNYPNLDYYFEPGATWSVRSQIGFSARILPEKSICGHKGPAIYVKGSKDSLLATLALLNSEVASYLLQFLVSFGAYEVGALQRLTMPRSITAEDEHELCSAAIAIVNSQRLVDTLKETSHAFVVPWLTPKLEQLWEHERSKSLAVSMHLQDAAFQVAHVNRLAEKIYNFTPRYSLAEGVGQVEGIEDEVTPSQGEAAVLLSYFIGIVFGRWIIPSDPEKLRKPKGDLFAALPEQAPGAAAVEASKLYYAEDSSGESPLINGCRVALRVATGLASVDGYEQDLCARLGVPTLRDYLSRPAGFFADHLSVYSKSRRNAPIYWPLSVRSGEFILWVYYPKLDADALPRLITEVLDPRLRSLNEEISSLVAEGRTAGRRGKLEALRLELSEMRQDFQELIAKGYKPNLNDGVLITACPLAKYFRHAGFRAKLEACWRELSRGDYDWSHLAMAMWPERVLAVCKKDRSIAIAHEREDLCPAEPPKVTRGRKKKTE